MRRGGCGCLGCGALLFVAFAILAGSAGVFAGDWAGLARPSLPDPEAAVADIPSDYLALYQAAGRQYGLDWPVLAAVGRVASDHGRLTADCAPDEVGAHGPMHFRSAPFLEAAGLARLGDPDICDPADAIPAAAAYLRARGAPDDWSAALAAHYPSSQDVELVLAWAQRYGYTQPVVWPLDGPVTQPFGPTDSALQPPLWYRGRWYDHFHAGLDIGAPEGTPVVAIASGLVTFADEIADGAVVVEIEHAPGVTSVYAHLEPHPPVREGESVVAGQPIGSIGLTGITTGPHLHLAVWSAGEPIDPLTVLPARKEVLTDVESGVAVLGHRHTPPDIEVIDGG